MPNLSIHGDEYWEHQEGRSGGKVDGARTAGFVLGPGAPENPRVLILDMEPGYVIPRHCHSCERFEIVVTGSIRVGDDVFGPGDVMLAHADEFYGPKVAGPEGCMTAEVFSDTVGSNVLTWELADGSAYVWERGKPIPGELAQIEWIEARRAEVLGAGAVAFGAPA